MKLAVISDDDIGPEAVALAVKVLDAVLVEKISYYLGARPFQVTGLLLLGRRLGRDGW
ncbi:hypothetical protein [Mycobacterium sp.]|uniref:hypothetical protein n=1 Tax=Mycobacterium sp. TaxID=1785 RepID=UPI003C796882